MGIPKRIRRTAGRHSLVDGIPFTLPVKATESPVLMAIFKCDAEKAKQFLPPTDIHPFKFFGKALLVVTVIDYRETVIGKYIEYSIAIACTHTYRPAPPLLPLIFQKTFGLGQFVIDLPVSSEVSVKGGKGIWGMPKHQANLDFKISDSTVSSQYDLDGKLCTYVEIEKPGKPWFPANLRAANFCAFRGMLFKSDVYFQAKAAFCLGKNSSAKFIIGDHPRVQPLKELEIEENPLLTVLDDQVESWYLNFDEPPAEPCGPGILNPLGEGLESVVNLTNSEAWLPPPTAPVPGVTEVPSESGSPGDTDSDETKEVESDSSDK